MLSVKRFENLESQYVQQPGSPIAELVNLPLNALEEYFRSHPPAAERRAAMQRGIAARNWSASMPTRAYDIRGSRRTRPVGRRSFFQGLSAFESLAGTDQCENWRN